MNEPYVYVSPDNPAITKNNNLCSSCGHCYAVCQEDNGVAGRDRVACIHCGQCSVSCPEQAISFRNDIAKVRAQIADPSKIVVFSTSPSVRVGLDDAFHVPSGKYVEGKMVSALRAIGGDYVLDVTFSADLTIMEEGTELIERILHKTAPLPQFTSCCPAWVKFMEMFHPEKLAHISSAKSPIGMQGPLVKTYFASKHGISPEQIVHVAVTPCTAKKFEIVRPEMNVAGRIHGTPAMRDTDYVITTKELALWLREDGIDYDTLPEDRFDSILGKGSGAGVIFGNTGGVMEAALRAAYMILEKKPAPAEALLEFSPVRGLTGVKEATVTVAGVPVRVAVIYGTKNAERFMESDAFHDYHFIEVMTCPGGCISGAGQPQGDRIPASNALRRGRINSMYAEDRRMTLRNSIDNPEVQAVYKELLQAPESPAAKLMLHTKYYAR